MAAEVSKEEKCSHSRPGPIPAHDTRIRGIVCDTAQGSGGANITPSYKALRRYSGYDWYTCNKLCRVRLTDYVAHDIAVQDLTAMRCKHGIVVLRRDGVK